MSKKKRFVPITPAGTPVIELEAASEKEAWGYLLNATAHMPYGSIDALKERGYTVEKWNR